MMKRKQTGITMIEVLVTVLVLTIGLAGVMTMETVAIETNHQSYLRTQAILQAQEMADRMHANPNGVTDGDYATAIPSTAPRSCLTNSCSTQQMAEFDKWEWEEGTKKHLPAGAGSISYSSLEQAHTITVSWTEEGSKTSGGTKSFSFVYKPMPLSLL